MSPNHKMPRDTKRWKCHKTTGFFFTHSGKGRPRRGVMCSKKMVMWSCILPSGKLTWQWNITIFDRKYIFNPGPFSSQLC